MYVEINMDIECFGGQEKKTLICNRGFRRKNLVIEMVKMGMHVKKYSPLELLRQIQRNLT